jgi:hypothetical protein
MHRVGLSLAKQVEYYRQERESSLLDLSVKYQRQNIVVRKIPEASKVQLHACRMLLDLFTSTNNEIRVCSIGAHNTHMLTSLITNHHHF